MIKSGKKVFLIWYVIIGLAVGSFVYTATGTTTTLTTPNLGNQCTISQKLLGYDVQGNPICATDLTGNGTITNNIIDPSYGFTRYDWMALYQAGQFNAIQFCGDPNNKTGEFYPDYNLAFRADKCYDPNTKKYSGAPADVDIAIIAKKGFSSSYRWGDNGNYTFSLTKLPGQGALLGGYHTAINGPFHEMFEIQPKTNTMQLYNMKLQIKDTAGNFCTITASPTGTLTCQH